MEIIKLEKLGICKEPFEAMNWLLKAKAKEGGRLRLDKIYKKDGLWCATDGYRIHAFFAEEHAYLTDEMAEDGVYEVISKDRKSIVLQKIEGEILDLEKHRTWPEHKNYRKQQLSVNPDDNYSIAYTQIIRIMNEDYTLNHKYVKDAMDGEMQEVYYYGDIKPVIFVNGDKIAAIMPLRV